MFFPAHPADGTDGLRQVYPELIPKAVENQYVPKVYGFKIYGRKGSKYEKKEEKAITYYTQEELKKIKARNDPKERHHHERDR